MKRALGQNNISPRETPWLAIHFMASYLLAKITHPFLPNIFTFFVERRLTRAMQAIGRLFKPGMNRCR
jgi:hypothetical protein